jgi:hypothetical protein
MRKKERRSWFKGSLARYLLLLIIGGGSVLVYIALAMTINGQPSSRSFPGWVAVLQPETEAIGDDVLLRVRTDTKGVHPYVSYMVGACGPHRIYRADLLIGGEARLINAFPDPEPGLGTTLDPGPNARYSSESPRFQRLSDLKVSIINYLGDGNLGPVQVVSIHLTNVGPCHSTFGSSSDGVFTGTAAQGLGGFLSAPIQRSWTGFFGWWHGPHVSEAWPLLGSFPLPFVETIEPYPLGFVGLKGLSGSWTLPHVEAVQINSDNVPSSWSIDSSHPATTSSSSVNWSSVTPVRPAAELTDTESITALQQELVFAGVGLGIGGALLASLAFEWLRPPKADNPMTEGGARQGQTVVESAAPQSQHSSEVPTRSRSKIVAGIVIATGLAVGLTRRYIEAKRN